MDLAFYLLYLLLDGITIVLGVALEGIIGAFTATSGALVTSIGMYQVFADGHLTFGAATISGIPFVVFFIVIISVQILIAMTKKMKGFGTNS